MFQRNTLLQGSNLLLTYATTQQNSVRGPNNWHYHTGRKPHTNWDEMGCSTMQSD